MADNEFSIKSESSTPFPVLKPILNPPILNKNKDNLDFEINSLLSNINSLVSSRNSENKTNGESHFSETPHLNPKIVNHYSMNYPESDLMTKMRSIREFDDMQRSPYISSSKERDEFIDERLTFFFIF